MDPGRHPMHDYYHWTQTSRYKEMENKNTRPRRQWAKVQKASQADPPGPHQITNRRMACAHNCIDKANCKHGCCREGLSTPVRVRHRRRTSQARFPFIQTNPVSSRPDLHYTPIESGISGTLTSTTEVTPSSANVSAGNPMNTNKDDWLATHFPPTYFMESPIGSGRFVVLVSKLQRRLKGMPSVYTSRYDAVSAGMTEIFEAGMLEEQKETDIAMMENNRATFQVGSGDTGQLSGLGHTQDSLLNENVFPEQDHNSNQLHFHRSSQHQEYRYEHRLEQGQTSATHLGSDSSLIWAQLADLWEGGQMQTPRNQDQWPHQGQLPIWKPNATLGIPQSAQDIQQVPQEGSDHSQWPTFAQLLPDIEKQGWDQYDPTFILAPDTTTHLTTDSTIQPSTSSSDAITSIRTGIGTALWNAANPPTSSQPQTSPPPRNQNTDCFDTESLSNIATNINTNTSTNTIPRTSSENPGGLADLFEDTTTGLDAAPARFEAKENFLLTNEQLNEILGGKLF